MELGDATPVRVATGNGGLIRPAISAGWLAWTEVAASGEMRLRAQRRGTTVPFDLGASTGAAAQIHRDRVLWMAPHQGRLERDVLMLHDLEAASGGPLAWQAIDCPEPLSIVFAVDQATRAETALPAIQQGLRAILSDDPPATLSLALVTFGLSAELRAGFDGNHAEFAHAVETLEREQDVPDGRLDLALDWVTQALVDAPDEGSILAVLITDGLVPPDVAQRAAIRAGDLRAIGVTLQAIAPHPEADRAFLASIASPGRTFVPADTADVPGIVAGAGADMQGCALQAVGGFDLSDEIIVRAAATIGGGTGALLGDGVIVGHDARAISTYDDLASYLTGFAVAQTTTGHAQPATDGLDVAWSAPKPGQPDDRHILHVPASRQHTLYLPYASAG
jgi:hypothetical protein